MFTHFLVVVLIEATLVNQVLSEPTTTCSVVQGLPGLNGRDGRDGVNGQKGEPGKFGEPGSPGIAGSPGLKGSTGPPGKVGPQGSKGDAGARGNPGPFGARGEQGQPGEKGEKGECVSADMSTLEARILMLEQKLSLLESNMKSQSKALLFNKGTRSKDKFFVSEGKDGTYIEANAVCTKAGGQVASPRNTEENEAMLNIVKQFGKPAFLGINDIETEGVFKYVTGEKTTYSNWAKNEPNNHEGNEDCIEISALRSGQWNDYRCDKNLLIICEFQ